MKPIIEFESMEKRFKRTRAVDGLSLSVPEGSILALLGPNGAGKTTTIKTMLNLYRPEDERRLTPVDFADLKRLATPAAEKAGCTVPYARNYDAAATREDGSCCFVLPCPDAGEATIRTALGGHICRCTGYTPIVQAALAAAAEMRGDGDV